MMIETPSGSGNFIDIYWGANGDLYLVIEGTDSTGFRYRSQAQFLGHGKGGVEPEKVQRLLSALAPFASQMPCVQD